MDEQMDIMKPIIASDSHLRDGAHYPINASVSSQSQSLVL